jgi:hypothetical protein
MPIAVLVLALVVYAYALLAYPEFRRWGIAGGVLAAAALAVYLGRQNPESVRSASRIDASEVVLQDLTLDRTPRGATLSGRIRNDSPSYRLRDLTLELRLHDCPDANAAPETCPVIGEATTIARPDVPPGQLRALSAHFIFSDLPPVTGTLGWDWRIARIRATSE